MHAGSSPAQGLDKENVNSKAGGERTIEFAVKLFEIGRTTLTFIK